MKEENLRGFQIYGKWLGGGTIQERDTGLKNPTLRVWDFQLHGIREEVERKESITSFGGKLSLRYLTFIQSGDSS